MLLAGIASFWTSLKLAWSVTCSGWNTGLVGTVVEVIQSIVVEVVQLVVQVEIESIINVGVSIIFESGLTLVTLP